MAALFLPTPGRGAAVFSDSLCWHDVLSRVPWWMWCIFAWKHGIFSTGPPDYPHQNLKGLIASRFLRETNGLMVVVLMGIVVFNQ